VFALRIFITLPAGMELELKCPACTKYYNNPVCLPCSHSLCMACALRLQAPVTNGDDLDISRRGADYPELDKMSLYSEADSGVSMGTGSSRPNSYFGNSTVNLLARVQSEQAFLTITCPNLSCKKVTYLAEEGTSSLPKNRVLETIVDKYQTEKNFAAPCQVCQTDVKPSATTMCEQCEVFYCDKCKDAQHPLRGPLAQHNLVTPLEGKKILRQKNREIESRCRVHTDEVLSMFCLICKETVCYLCIQEGDRHVNHDVQATAAICKAHKVSTVF